MWDQFDPGVDFEWLTTIPPGSGRLLNQQFAFRFARFLAPVSVGGYTASCLRTGVIAQFADGDPVSTGVSPLVLVGLWGGLLDDAAIRFTTDPTTGRLAAALEFP